MSNSWDDDEEGEEIPVGSWRRALRIGKMGAKVGASSLASKLRSFMPVGDRAERSEQLERAFRNNAEQIAEVLGQLKGASMKVGQLLSADPELLPEGFSDVIASLQRDAPPMTYQTAVRQIEESLGRDIDTVFSYFEPEPIGSASIGQVHRAKLESGEEVAVKIQYPGVVDALESDLTTLRRLLVYGRIVLDRERLNAYFDEIREIVYREADYENEAMNMEDFAEIFRGREGFRAPTPHERWTSPQVLTMEYVDGEKLDEALVDRSDSERRDILRRWVETYMWLFHEQCYMHADPHPGNFLLDEEDTIWVLDYGCVKRFEQEFADGFLEILVASWEGDHERAIEAYEKLGYVTGKSGGVILEPELVGQFHDIILEPFLTDGPFDFNGWNPAMRAKKFSLRHPSFLKMTPPTDALMYYRVLSGIKGLLNKLDVQMNVRELAEGIARRRGML